MKRSPEKEAWLLARLQEAVARFGNGSADAFGRFLGYTNGGSVRQSLRQDRPVQQAIIDRAHEKPELAGWFAYQDEITQPSTAVSAGTPFSALNAYEAALVTVVRDGLTEEELTQITQAVKNAVNRKKSRVATDDAHEPIGVYFNVERRAKDEPREVNRRSSWNVSSGDSPELRQVTGKKMGASK